jgi:hypothetical protein
MKNLFWKIFKRKHVWKIFGYKSYVKLCFKDNFGYSLDLKHPKTYQEKIQWIKVFGDLEKFSKYVDKYDVREFIKEKIGEQYSVPLIGVYDNVEDIDFEYLPNSFVIKATHGSAWNIIVRNKSDLDQNKAKEKMQKWIDSNFYKVNGERNYKPLKGRIIIEEYLEDISTHIIDYKFLCFKGEPKCIIVEDRVNSKGNGYDLNWNKLPVSFLNGNISIPIKKPERLEEMNELSRKLSKDFPFVRVDFYNINGRIYFCELTFTSGNGMGNITPKEYAYTLGDYIDINTYNSYGKNTN